MLGKIFEGYKALFSLASGDVDTAYNLTHKKKLKEDKREEATTQRDASDSFYCCGCKKKLNSRVRKCICGMEYG